MKDLALKLKATRIALGLTQEQAAKMSGVHVKTLSTFETGRRISQIRLADLESLLHAYGVRSIGEFESWSLGIYDLELCEAWKRERP